MRAASLANGYFSRTALHRRRGEWRFRREESARLAELVCRLENVETPGKSVAFVAAVHN